MNYGLPVLLSRSFLGIGSLVFSETQHGVIEAHVVLCLTTGAFEKENFTSKMGQK